MVHFVLEARRKQAVDLPLVLRAVQILPAGADPGRAFDLGVDLGNRETAFGIDRMIL